MSLRGEALADRKARAEADPLRGWQTEKQEQQQRQEQ